MAKKEKRTIPGKVIEARTEEIADLQAQVAELQK